MSLTIIFTVTVSPGSAVTVSSCQIIAPEAAVIVVVVVVVVVVEASVVVVVGAGVVVVVVAEPLVAVVVVVGAEVVVVVVEAAVVVVVFFLILIAPSTSVTFLVMSRPFVSETNASDHLTGYLPSAQSSGTVNVSVSTVAPSAAATPEPIDCANANSFVLAFSTNVAS